MKRRCGFISEEERGVSQLVWLRGDLAIDECPKSYITPQSLYYLDLFSCKQMLAERSRDDLSAKEAEAFMILEAQWKTEEMSASK